MIAIVIGGTGLTGSLLVRKVLNDPTITKVISIGRGPLGIANSNLEEVLVRDLAELPALEASLRGDLYFCCLGATMKTAGSKENFEKVDHDAIVAFAKMAKAQAARSFTFISSMGANASSMFFYTRVKGRTENEVKAAGLRSLTIFRPAFLIGRRKEFRLADSVAGRTLVPVSRIFPIPLRNSLITEAETLAERMLDEGKTATVGVHIIAAKDI